MDSSVMGVTGVKVMRPFVNILLTTCLTNVTVSCFKTANRAAALFSGAAYQNGLIYHGSDRCEGDAAFRQHSLTTCLTNVTVSCCKTAINAKYGDVSTAGK